MSIATTFLLFDAIVFVVVAAITWMLRFDRWSFWCGVAFLVARAGFTWHQQRTMRERAD